MRVVLCDDSSEERAYYSDFIRSVAESEDIELELTEYENAKQLLFDIEEQVNIIDIIFLDINMPHMSGMQAADKLRQTGYKGEIVFMTVSKEHMLGAFDVRAFNYIVKGETSRERIEHILRDVLRTAEDRAREYMLFTGIGEYRNIAIASIKYFEVRGRIITVYYNDKEFEFVSTIGKLENLLFTRGFVRIHRSFMVAVAAVKSFSYEELVLSDGRSLPVGRKYYPLLKESMAKSVLV